MTKVAVNRKGTQSVTVWFSEDVAASITADDLVLRTEDGVATIDPALMTVGYDAARRAATWTFANLPGGVLPAGRDRATVLSSGVTDTAGQALDGNRDRAPGGDYVSKSVIRL